MILKGSLRRDGLTTQMTIVFIFASVRLDVHHQRVLVGKCLAAEFALMFHRFEIRIVDLQMTHQSVIVGKRLVAGGTYVLLSAVLNIHMPVKLGVCEKALVADLAVPRILLEVTFVMSS